MRTRQWLLSLGLGAVLAGAAGCAGTKPGQDRPAATGAKVQGTAADAANPQAMVTPVSGLAGRVASVNPAYQFVVITLEGGPPPVPDQKLAIYRAQLKVGEVKVSREQMGRNVVADIVAGEARVGDEVRGE